MAVLRVSSTRFTGLTADSKPTTYNSIAVPTNSIYLDTQLFLEYVFDGAAWQLRTEKGVTETMTGKTITDPVFDNFVDLNRITIPSDPAANKGRMYVKTIDSNNDGIFIKIKKAGAYVEVQIA